MIRKVYDATPAGNAVPDDKARATMRNGVAEILAVHCGRWRRLGAIPPVPKVLSQRGIKACDQVRHGNRLGKEAGRPGLHRARADAFIGESRDEDEGRGVPPHAHVR